MPSEYRERPTLNGSYTEEDLREYANYRKNRSIGTLKSLLADERVQSGEKAIDDQEEYRAPLSIETTTLVKVQLSWGGDGDGYKLEYSSEGELLSGIYYWEDWFVYEEVPLDSDELRLVEQAYDTDSLVEAR